MLGTPVRHPMVTSHNSPPKLVAPVVVVVQADVEVPFIVQETDLSFEEIDVIVFSQELLVDGRVVMVPCRKLMRHRVLVMVYIVPPIPLTRLLIAGKVKASSLKARALTLLSVRSSYPVVPLAANILLKQAPLQKPKLVHVVTASSSIACQG